MGYSSRHGRRPDENASKSSHSHVINDSEVQHFLAGCNLPKKAKDISLSGYEYLQHTRPAENPIRHVIAIDGGYNLVTIDKDFPSSEICFFQFGALIFSVSDLEHLAATPFINPDDMAKLKNIQRLKLVLPVRQVILSSCSTIADSVRRAVFDFFCHGMEDEHLIETLRWFLFEEYETPKNEWVLASCPLCNAREVSLLRSSITKDYMVPCAHCKKEIYLTDVFRLHEAVDNEMGAGGILGYLMTTIEQILAVHLVRLILKTKPPLLRSVLFVKDGPLAFFGQTANMHKPMRKLVQFLFQKQDFFMAGLEKSGAFVEHADQIADLMKPATALILNNDYIYRYIIPNSGDPSSAYGRTTYYGHKLIFKTSAGGMYVVTVPTAQLITSPTRRDFQNLDAILSNIEMLRCDMYDNSLIPVALANKLVSLANHPSSKILQRFALDSVGH
jgi:hypothetical protein